MDKVAVMDALHAAVQAEFECTLGDIAGMSDTFEKFMCVFILRFYYEWDIRSLALVYKLPVPFVPTVVKCIERWYEVHPSVADLIHALLDAVEKANEVKPKAA